MTETPWHPDRFEIVYNPTDGTAFIYRYVHGGICGPITSPVPVVDRQAAEAEARRHSLVRSGPWVTDWSGGASAPVERTLL